MCGIAGFLEPPGSVDRLVSSVQQLLAHRGPDDEGVFGLFRGGRVIHQRKWPREEREAPAALLLHRRLSILDLSETGWQPMISENRQCVLIYNGEVYNYRELRREMELAGVSFRGSSDTEVILKGYQTYGRAVVHRLVGMFAFAILDLQQRELFLARDAFGIKPLFFAQVGRSFGFASEIKALLELDGVSRRCNPGRLWTYLRYGQTDSGPETLFADVSSLEAGCTITVSLDRPEDFRVDRFYRLDLGPRIDLSFEEACRELRSRFLRSVKLHLRSDVPVGAALSGGVDSSAIAMCVRHLEGSALDLHTFTYAADDPAVREEHYADLVSRQASARAHKTRPDCRDLPGDLRCLIRAHDEPVATSSMWAQWCVFRLVRDTGIKVILDGQGADEMLAGYPGYRAARCAALLLDGRPDRAARFAFNVWRHQSDLGWWSRMGQFLISPSLQGPLRRLVGEPLDWPWFRRDWFRKRGAAGHPKRPVLGRDAFREDLVRSVFDISLPALLRYGDRSSMAFSVESRVPFLTVDLLEFVLSLPDEYLLSSNGTTKSVFREAMRDLVPDPVLDRKDKIGFATPELSYLHGLTQWAEAVISSDTARSLPFLDYLSLSHAWRKVLDGEGDSSAVLRSLMVILWSDILKVEFD